jgi:pimeloyl-ACP methyl ester carboxylesterase
MPGRSVLLVPLAWILLAGCQPPAETPPLEAMPAGPVTGTVESADGVPIVYESRGAGDVALLFVHGWSCNREFWREQVDVFDDDYRVVTLDLGGHGASGTMRDPWRVRGLAADVVAVSDALALERIVLVGHSMGGPVSLEAAHRLHGRVLGVVAVDALQNAEFEFPTEIVDRMLEGMRADYPGSVERMFSGMASTMQPELKDWVVAQAKQATPEVAVALMADYSAIDMAALFRGAGVPIRAINATSEQYPTDVEVNRRHADFDVVEMDGVGHFLQLERPDEFNAHLKMIVTELVAGG